MSSLVITIVFFILSLIAAVGIAASQRLINKYPFQSFMFTLFLATTALQFVIIFILLHN